jgi:hypothetical protein
MTVPCMLPAAVRSASASTVRIFRSSIQSSSSRCVRFKTTVADDPATLATGRALPPTRSTGWIAPASPGAHKQLLSLSATYLWKRAIFQKSWQKEGRPQGGPSLGRKRPKRRTQHLCCTAQQCFNARFVQWEKQITICLFRQAGTFSGECAFCAAACFTVPDGCAPLSSQESWCPRSTRSTVLATLPLNVLDGSLYVAVQQEIAVTHFLGVSSLNSGRGQPRPFSCFSVNGL